jgi:hypothetical protein
LWLLLPVRAAACWQALVELCKSYCGYLLAIIFATIAVIVYGCASCLEGGVAGQGHR